MIRVVFFGSSEFSLPSLECLYSDARYVIAAVVSVPAKPIGRHQLQTPTPVSMFAEERGVPLYTPTKLIEIKDILQAADADVFVVVAYGKLIPIEIIHLAKKGTVNIHPSLLPAYRGPAPIAYVLTEGKSETGVTLMQIDELLDHGPIIVQTHVPITHDDDRGSLEHRLSAVGAALLVNELPHYIEGKLTLRAQDHTKATYTKLLNKASGCINWEQPATTIGCLVRAMSPWPHAWTVLGEKRLIIHQCKTDMQYMSEGLRPGTLVRTINNQLAIVTGDGALIPTMLQFSGGSTMGNNEFLRGYSRFVGRTCANT